MFRFREGSRHLRELRLRHLFGGFHPGEGRATWDTNAVFRDKSADDEFNWFVQFAIFMIPRSRMEYRTAQIRTEHTGGPHSYQESFTSDTLKGLHVVTVVLTGWRFGFWNEDHHLTEMGIRLTNINYARDTGTVTWTVTSTFRDRNGDDDYYWMYDYLVIGLGQTIADENIVLKTMENTESRQGATMTVIPVTPQWWEIGSMASDAARSGRYTHFVVLPQGWNLKIPRVNIVPQECTELVENLPAATDVCQHLARDVHVRKIAVDLTARNWDPLVVAEPGAAIGPYRVSCTPDCPSFSTTLPHFTVDVAMIQWIGGGRATYPPEDWLNGGAGWRCDCDANYELHQWQYNLQPDEFEPWG